MRLLEKKKNNRPLVIDLIDYFTNISVPGNFNIKVNDNDYDNYTRYSDKCRKAFDKKRMIESN